MQFLTTASVLLGVAVVDAIRFAEDHQDHHEAAQNLHEDAEHLRGGRGRQQAQPKRYVQQLRHRSNRTRGIFGSSFEPLKDLYDQPPSTEKGCRCTSACSASLSVYCYTTPVCSVSTAQCPGGAAESSTFGYYDYCLWEKYVPYESLSGKEKYDLLMKHITTDTTPGSFSNIISVVPGIVMESVKVSFDMQSDVFTHARFKYIHSVGVTAGFKFESNGNHKYSGVFQGHEHGILRLSSAKQPLWPSTPGILPRFTPGVGIKFLRDGRPSANFFAMPGLDGQPCTESNFFSKDFSNHLPNTDDLALGLLASKFWQASNCPLMVGLSDLASMGADGSKAAAGSFPYQLILKTKVKVPCSCWNYKQRCLNAISRLNVGTALWEVYAIDKPGGEAQPIGQMVLTTQPTTSKFGDERLFFKHQRMEEDFQVNEQWLDAMPDKKNTCGMPGISTQPPPHRNGCQAPAANAVDYFQKVSQKVTGGGEEDSAGIKTSEAEGDEMRRDDAEFLDAEEGYSTPRGFDDLDAASFGLDDKKAAGPGNGDEVRGKASIPMEDD
eukprot:TRINITY_DN80618_c0_g1_i1.p1 TRINITY_DN80618_c0_g1~~TRINITY_DN80618_c0_g1_i1.p1  ORF type:complete len:551 (+),score=106.79 TRINITY_DN80618_c0_g1_i1:82-1734(+)